MPERIDKSIARVASALNLDQLRLRTWVSFLALCGVLEKAIEEGVIQDYYIKGGVIQLEELLHHSIMNSTAYSPTLHTLSLFSFPHICRPVNRLILNKGRKKGGSRPPFSNLLTQPND
jgi:hypothetical protein